MFELWKLEVFLSQKFVLGIISFFLIFPILHGIRKLTARFLKKKISSFNNYENVLKSSFFEFLSELALKYLFNVGLVNRWDEPATLRVLFWVMPRYEHGTLS